MKARYGIGSSQWRTAGRNTGVRAPAIAASSPCPRRSGCTGRACSRWCPGCAARATGAAPAMGPRGERSARRLPCLQRPRRRCRKGDSRRTAGGPPGLRRRGRRRPRQAGPSTERGHPLPLRSLYCGPRAGGQAVRQTVRESAIPAAHGIQASVTPWPSRGGPAYAEQAAATRPAGRYCGPPGSSGTDSITARGVSPARTNARVRSPMMDSPPARMESREK
jgi:hypothetical protein